MEHSVKLARLPAELTIPERLRERMSFDPAKGLSYRGFMTKCTYDELCSLTDDPDYHRALEQLFVLTSEEVAPRRPISRLPAAIIVATIGAAALAIGAMWFAAHHLWGESQAGPESGVAVSSGPR
jgi:hypothetical protein